MNPEGFTIRIAGEKDQQFAEEISKETEQSAIARGSGIAKRTPESIREKLSSGKAVIAVAESGKWAGFSYIEVWANGEFVSNSGLIVAPEFRKGGVAKAIKKKIFSLGRKLFPAAKIFSITTGLAIMKMNARLKFETVTFNELPHETAFWQGCRSCVNFDILKRKNYKNCLCTAMVFNPVHRCSKTRDHG